MELTIEHSATVCEVLDDFDFIHLVDGNMVILEADTEGLRYVRKWLTNGVDVNWGTPAFPDRVRFNNSRVLRDYRKIGSLGKYGVLY